LTDLRKQKEKRGVDRPAEKVGKKDERANVCTKCRENRQEGEKCLYGKSRVHELRKGEGNYHLRGGKRKKRMTGTGRRKSVGVGIRGPNVSKRSVGGVGVS